MSSLRILHVVPYYEQAWAYGGIPRLAAAMARGLAGRGHHVTVCTTDACDATSRLATGASVRLQEPGHVDVRVFPNLSNRLAYHYQLFTPWGLATHLRRHAPSFDAAHLHACHNLPGAIAARALTRAGVPYVVSPNGTAAAIERRVLAKRLFAATAGRHVIPGAARVLAVTAAEQAQLAALGVPDRRIVILPNPVDDTEFEPAADGDAFRRGHHLGDRKVVLFLGKLTPRKGVDVLLRAFSTLQRGDATLVVAGNDMGAGRSIDSLVVTLGLEPAVVRVGLLRGRERLNALAAADVVVYPSQHEVFGLVAAEALMCGTPVVVSGDSGCGEMIGRVGGGHIVPYGDPVTLAGAIASILDAPVLWRARARTAASRVRDLFNSRIVCERLELIYRELVHETRSASRQSA
jgi:glycosyltransferase involved in cell wall biosynthesis